MNKERIFKLFWMFIIISVLGYIIEGIYTTYPEMVLLNHSALVIGPFNIIYGFGAILLTAVLYKLRDDKLWKIFIISFIVGSLLEYFVSWGTEVIFGHSAWNYSNDFLNINGRISLKYSIFWGLLGVGWIKYGYSFIMKIIDKINKPIMYKISIFIFVFLIFDSCISIHAVFRANNRDNFIPAKNDYERFLDKAFPNKYLNITYGRHWSE